MFTMGVISRRDLDCAHAALRRLAALAERDQARNESYTGHLTKSAEIDVGALAAGVIPGRFSNMELFGIIPSRNVSTRVRHRLGEFYEAISC
jgi:hypothetical protein